MVKINGETWKILLVSPYHPGLRKSNGSYAWGTCNDNNKTIYINDNLSSFYTKKVLCHELTHAAMFSYNIDLSLEQEEILADLIATYGQEIIGTTNIIFKRIQEIGEA
jgi:hypothetical protein